jgi:hypothetical protein
MGANSDLRGEKPTTNPLSYGTAIRYHKNITTEEYIFN